MTLAGDHPFEVMGWPNIEDSRNVMAMYQFRTYIGKHTPYPRMKSFDWRYGIQCVFLYPAECKSKCIQTWRSCLNQLTCGSNEDARFRVSRNPHHIIVNREEYAYILPVLNPVPRSGVPARERCQRTTHGFGSSLLLPLPHLKKVADWSLSRVLP